MSLGSMLANRRSVVGEIMDSPQIDPADHLRALQGLERINRVSKTAERMLGPIAEMARRRKLGRLSVLDVACGGGDVPIGLALQARRLDIEIELTLMDRSPTAVEQATAQARRQAIACWGAQGDAVDALPAGEFDVITNSLFLHHLNEPQQVIGLLGRMRQAARRMVVISDLQRCRLGLAAAWIGCRVLSGSAIVHHDGPVSVRAAWTMNEMARFADRAGLARARVENCWPWRMLLVWENRLSGAGV